MKNSDVARRTIKVACAASLAAVLTAGCGSSGGLSNLFSSGSSSSSSSSASTRTTTATTASTSTATTTATTTTTTTTPTTTTKATTGNSLYVVMTDPVEQQSGSPVGKVTSTSPATGSQTTASFTRGAWSEVQASTIPKDDGGNDQWIVQQYNTAKQSDPNVKIYQRTGTNAASYTNGPAGSTSGSASSDATDYFLASCAPGSSGCFPKATQTHTNDFGTAIQNGKSVDENTVQVGKVTLTNKEVNKPFGPNQNLKYVEIGKYSESVTTHDITAAGGQGLQQLPNGLYFNPQGTGQRTEGYFFTGTATSAADMAGLASGPNPVTARYQGRFEGDELTTTRRQVQGNVDMTADFGKGTVSGNVYGIQAYSNCNSGQCTQTSAGYNINMNAKITGSQYQGTAQFASPTTSSPTTVTGTSGKGDVVGGFFGPKAAETAGSVRVNGTAPGVKGTDTTVIGGYGATKTP